jgi:hypothetical protein
LVIILNQLARVLTPTGDRVYHCKIISNRHKII